MGERVMSSSIGSSRARPIPARTRNGRGDQRMACSDTHCASAGKPHQPTGPPNASDTVRRQLLAHSEANPLNDIISAVKALGADLHQLLLLLDGQRRLPIRSGRFPCGNNDKHPSTDYRRSERNVRQTRGPRGHPVSPRQSTAASADRPWQARVTACRLRTTRKQRFDEATCPTAVALILAQATRQNW